MVRGLWGALLFALAGCGRAPEGPTGTGAEQVVRDYWEALLRRDWRGAYATLLPASRRKCRIEEFTRRGELYLRRLGFDPKEVRLRSCEEHGDEAIARVVLLGQAGAGQRLLQGRCHARRGEAGWGIVLPQRFGSP